MKMPVKHTSRCIMRPLGPQQMYHTYITYHGAIFNSKNLALISSLSDVRI